MGYKKEVVPKIGSSFLTIKEEGEMILLAQS